MTNTEAQEYRFIVKEQGDGTPWLVLEPMRKNLKAFGRGFLGLRLREGSTYGQAQDIAAYLDEHIESVSYTDLSL